MKMLTVPIREPYKSAPRRYLFSEVAARVRAFAAEHPARTLLPLGIGDVTLPLSPVVLEAMHRAVAEMGEQASFRGYAPEQGYLFLREALARSYRRFGVTVSPEDIWISDGAKNDAANLTELFGDAPIYLQDPVYPVYFDSNLLAGRRIFFLRGTKENGFLPTDFPRTAQGAVFYLCSPNNPTGAVYSREALAHFVRHARESGSLLIFDAAYETFLEKGRDLPHSIYEIPGAEECAVELGSFSKSAGFTGVRCSWAIFPRALAAGKIPLGALWARRQATKTNGVSYITQRGAEAALSEAGTLATDAAVGYYKENAALLAKTLRRAGVFFTGGTSSPYLFLECPGKMDSWRFFEALLTQTGIIGTPGVGFGAGGEGFFRLSAFSSRELTKTAAAHLLQFLERGDF